MLSKMHMLIYLVPLLLLFMTGYLARVTGYFSSDNEPTLADFFLRFSVPAVIFLLLMNVPLDQIDSYADFCVAFILGTVLPYYASVWLLRLSGMNHKASNYFASTGSFANVAAVTLPLILSMPHSGALVHAFTIAILLQLVMIILLLIRPYEGVSGGLMYKVKVVGEHMIQSPIVCAVILGVLAASIHLRLPDVLYKTIHPIGMTIAALGLICLGLNLRVRSLMTCNIAVWLMVVMKVIISPVLAYGLALGLGLSDAETSVLVIMNACPTAAISAMIVSKKTSLDDEASSVMAGSIVFGFISLGVWMSILPL